MIKYIIEILRTYMQDTIFNTIIYNMLMDGDVRRNIVYNVKSDKFEIPVHKLMEQYPNVSWMIDFSSISPYKQKIEGTNVYIQVWEDIFSFWIE